MEDLWRLSAADIAALIDRRRCRRRRPRRRRWRGSMRSIPRSTPWSITGPEEVLAAGRCRRRGDRARRGRRAAGGRAGHGQGQYRPGRLCHHQRPQAAARRHRAEQQPGDRQSAQGRRRHSRPHQLPGVFLSLVHHQSDPWRHQKSARSRHHAGRLVRRRRGGGRRRHRPYRARHRYRGLDPLPRLCLRRARLAADASGGSRPSMRRCRNAPSGRRSRAVSGPLARTIGDLRIALAAMSGKDVRDPWWVPAPLEGPAMPKRAALCLQPDGLDTVAEVKAAVADAGKRLERAGWMVEEIDDTPPLREAADLQTKLWLGDGYEAQLDAAEREGDPGALACLRGNRAKVFPFDAAAFSKALTRRATLTREWLQFFETYAVLLMPVSGELPFPDRLDRKRRASFARVWRAQLPQIAIPFMGLPGANGLHRTGGPGSRRRANRLRPLPRGSVPARGRGDRGGRNAAVAGRSRQAETVAANLRAEHDGWRLRFHRKVACRRGRAAEAVRGSGAPDRQHRERLRVHAAIQGLEALHRRTRPARLCGARISLQPVRRPGAGRRQADRAVLLQQLCTSPFRCSPRSTSTAPTRIRSINI